MTVQRFSQAVLATFLLSIAVPGMALSEAAKAQGLPSLAPMLEEVTPAVVSIRVIKAMPTGAAQRFGQGQIPEELRRFLPDMPQAERLPEARGAGSGVIIDGDQGYVVTNHHVVANARQISVQLHDGRNLEASLVGSDPNTDIALLQLDESGLQGALREIAFADIETVAVGDYVVAIGNPFGIGQTATQGIVSALGRAGLNSQNYEDFIQTDAAINMGNSGGALVDLEGNLVGINTAIISGSGGSNGVGFAVPVDMVAAVLEHLERDGEVRRGMLGVTITDVTADVAETMDLGVEEGALVTSVLPGSAAEAAGVQISDVIVAVDGNAVTSSRELRNVIGLMRRGEQAVLRLYRNGEALSLDALIGGPDGESALSSEGVEAARSEFRGASLRSLMPGESEVRDRGVLVESVQPGSRAAAAGLQAGDIIVFANRREVRDLAAFNEVLDSADRLAAVTVLREGREQLLLVP